MSGYTLKLDLSEEELMTLKTVLITDLQRAERDGTADGFHATNVAKILDDIQGYGESLSQAVRDAERRREGHYE